MKLLDVHASYPYIFFYEQCPDQQKNLLGPVNASVPPVDAAQLPEISDMHDENEDVEIEDILSNMSGLPDDMDQETSPFQRGSLTRSTPTNVKKLIRHKSDGQWTNFRI